MHLGHSGTPGHGTAVPVDVVRRASSSSCVTPTQAFELALTLLCQLELNYLHSVCNEFGSLNPYVFLTGLSIDCKLCECQRRDVARMVWPNGPGMIAVQWT